MSLPSSDAILPRLHVDGLEVDDYKVIELHGTEELNQPYRFAIDLRSDRDTSSEALNLDDALGKPAVLRFGTADEPGQREIAGIITEAVHLNMTNAHVQTWRLVMHSPLWLLSLNRAFRTFMDNTVSDVVTQVAGDSGIAIDLDSTSYAPKRIIQHGESDLDLISRLLADEGMLWITKCVDGQPKLFSARDHARLCPDAETVYGVMTSSEAGHSGGGAVTSFHATRRAMLNNFRFTGQVPTQPERPAVSEGTVEGQPQLRANATRTVSNHHGGVRNSGTAFPGRRPAEVLADRTAALSHQANGSSVLHRLGAGFCLELSGHQSESCNVSWVIARIEHQWTSPGTDQAPVYTNRFACVPLNGKPLRPALAPPPAIAGLRMGIISENNVSDGDGGDEPGDLKMTGVYEVQFPSEPMDDGNPFTQRMRVALPWAGPDRGLHFPLEIGDEVVVAHEHGDPARPIIIGSLFSQARPGPSVESRGGGSVSGVLRSRTGHELRYDEEDGAGKITLKSATGEHDLVLDDGEKSTALTSQGTFSASASSDASVSAGEKLNLTGKGDAKFTTEAAGTVQSVGLLSISSTGGDLTISSPTKITISVGASSITLEPAKITIASTDIGVGGTASVVADAPTSQFGKAGAATTILGATIGLTGGTSITASAPAATVTATGEAVLHGGTVTVSASGAVAISGSSVGING